MARIQNESQSGRELLKLGAASTILLSLTLSFVSALPLFFGTYRPSQDENGNERSVIWFRFSILAGFACGKVIFGVICIKHGSDVAFKISMRLLILMTLVIAMAGKHFIVKRRARTLKNILTFYLSRIGEWLACTLSLLHGN